MLLWPVVVLLSVTSSRPGLVVLLMPLVVVRLLDKTSDRSWFVFLFFGLPVVLFDVARSE